MRSFNPLRLYRSRRRRGAAPPAVRPPPPAALRPLPEPTVYADAPLARLIAAIEHRVSDLEVVLADYARARRAAGVQPERVLIEFKRVLRRAIGAESVRWRLTGRLIELYFAA